MAAEGDLDCSKSEGEDISDETECRKAASALGLTFNYNETSTLFPKRCYVQKWYNLVYWNNDNVGGSSCTNCSPICKIEGINILLKNRSYVLRDHKKYQIS